MNPTTRWLLLPTILILAGCASTPVELPDWTLAERTPTAVTDPLDLPSLCAIPLTGSWNVECWKRLSAYDLAATANTSIAQANANALRKSDASYDSLIEAGKLQSQLAQIRQQLLEQERRAHMMDNWFYRGLITLGLIGIAL